MLTIGRLPGWIARWWEQEPGNKISPARQNDVGPRENDRVLLSERR